MKKYLIVSLALFLTTSLEAGIRETHGGKGVLYGQSSTQVMLRELASETVGCKIPGSPLAFGDSLAGMDQIFKTMNSFKVDVGSTKNPKIVSLSELYTQAVQTITTVCITKFSLKDKVNNIEKRLIGGKPAYQTATFRFMDNDGAEWFFVNERQWASLSETERLKIWLGQFAGEISPNYSPLVLTNIASFANYLVSKKGQIISSAEAQEIQQAANLRMKVEKIGRESNRIDNLLASYNDIKIRGANAEDLNDYFEEGELEWAKIFDRENGSCQFVTSEQAVKKLGFQELLTEISLAHTQYGELLSRQISGDDGSNRVSFCFTKNPLPEVPDQGGILSYKHNGIQIAARAKTGFHEMIFIDERYLDGHGQEVPAGHRPYLMLHELSQGLIDSKVSNRVMRLETLVRGVYELSGMLTFEGLENLLIASKAGEKEIPEMLSEEISKGNTNEVKKYTSNSWERISPFVAKIYVSAGLHGAVDILEILRTGLKTKGENLATEALRKELDQQMSTNFCQKKGESHVLSFYKLLTAEHPNLLSVVKVENGLLSYKTYGIFSSLVKGGCVQTLQQFRSQLPNSMTPEDAGDLISRISYIPSYQGINEFISWFEIDKFVFINEGDYAKRYCHRFLTTLGEFVLMEIISPNLRDPNEIKERSQLVETILGGLGTLNSIQVSTSRRESFGMCGYSGTSQSVPVAIWAASQGDKQLTQQLISSGKVNPELEAEAGSLQEELFRYGEVSDIDGKSLKAIVKELGWEMDWNVHTLDRNSANSRVEPKSTEKIESSHGVTTFDPLKFLGNILSGSGTVDTEFEELNSN